MRHADHPAFFRGGVKAFELIWTEDKPQVVFRTSGLNNGAIFNDTVDWNMDIYVVGATNEAPAPLAPQAYLPWTFNGSSTFPNNKWAWQRGRESLIWRMS